MGEVIIGIFCVLLIPVALGFAIGWAVRGRRDRTRIGAPNPPSVAADMSTATNHEQWLVAQLDQPPLRDVLTHLQREGLRAHFTSPAEPSAPTVAHVPPPLPADPIAAVTQATTVDPPNPPPLVVAPATAPQPKSGPDSRPQRAEWDPAVLMLYLGALLVVAAGLVYSSYNWADLSAWQKLGMLAATTIAFAGAGWILLSRERVRQAAETFVAIGALLVPANAVAAYTVLDGANARPEIPVFLGAIATAVVYGAFSIRPGGVFYAYGAAVAGFLACAALPAVLTFHPGWGAVLVLLVIAALPVLTGNLRPAIHHLEQPIQRVGSVLIPVALIAGTASAFDTTEWIAPATFATTTLALASLARRGTNPVPAVAATITAIGAIASALWAWDSAETWVASTVIVAAAFGWIALADRGPVWLRHAPVRLALHIEATFGFAAASAIMIADERAWGSTLSLLAGTAGCALIAWRRPQRWWMVGFALFAAATYVSIAAHAPSEDWSDLTIVRFFVPIPILLAVIAFGLDRWLNRHRTARNSWGEPVWIVAGTLAIPIVGGILATGESAWSTLLSATVLYAVAALVAAWSIPRPIVRLAYGIWIVLAAGTAVALMPLSTSDQVSTMAVLAAAVAALSLRPVNQSIPGLRSMMGKSTPFELYPLGIASGASLLGMLAITGAYVASSHIDWDAAIPEFRWTWCTYLTVFVVIAAGAILNGIRTSHIEIRLARVLSVIALVFGLAAAWLLLRIATTDLLTWTWVGIAVAVAGYVLASSRHPASRFGREFTAISEKASLALGAVAILANLGISLEPGWDGPAWTQAGIYAACGIIALGLATRTARAIEVWAGWASLALAVGFASFALDLDHTELALMLSALGWVAIGLSFVVARVAPEAAWRGSALALGVSAVLFTLQSLGDIGDDDQATSRLVVCLVSLAGLIAVDAAMRRGPVEGLIGSALALTALLIQIHTENPDNIHAYTVPLALYLLGVSWLFRRQPHQRDILIGAGSAMLLVPPLLLAQAEGSFRWMLVALGEALALFVVGLALRLRAAIAAAIAAISLIVLRMLVDAGNALPGWVTLPVVGLLLLGAGTAWLVWKDSIRANLDRLRTRWVAMG